MKTEDILKIVERGLERISLENYIFISKESAEDLLNEIKEKLEQAKEVKERLKIR